MQTPRSTAAVVAVTCLMGFAHIGSVAAATSADERARSLAEELAEAASKEFSAILQGERVAQADTSRAARANARSGNGSEPSGPLGWLRHSRQEFQSLMRMLAGERAPVQPWDPVAEAGKKADIGGLTAAKTVEAKKVETPATTVAPAPAPSSADTKQAAEERKLAEARRVGPETRSPEPGNAKPAAKADPAKGTDTPGVGDGRTKRPEGKRTADTKVAADPKKELAPKAADGSRAGTAAGKAEPGAVQPPAGAKVAANQVPAPAAAEKAAAEPPPAATAKGPSPADRPAAPAAGPPPRRGSLAACKRAGRKIDGSGWYIARSGDTLWSIAEVHFGSGMDYRRIRAANRRGIADPDRIHPCQRIYIPRRGLRQT